MPKKFYQVIKDGQIIGTRSSDRDYTHAVVHWNTHREIKGEFVAAEKHVSHIEYCGRLALAQSKLRQAVNGEIIEVTKTERK